MVSFDQYYLLIAYLKQFIYLFFNPKNILDNRKQILKSIQIILML